MCFLQHLVAMILLLVRGIQCRAGSPCSEIRVGVFSCSDRGIQAIPSFPDRTVSIDLSHNSITVIDTTLSSLHGLIYLSLGSNQVEYINASAFLNLTSLKRLDLSYNRLTSSSLDDIIFPEPCKLEELSVQGNLYTDYPERSLSKMIFLQKLHLDVFRGFVFGNGFLNLRNLSSITFNPRSSFSLLNTTFLGLSNSPINHLELNFDGWVMLPIEADVLFPFRSIKTIRIDIHYKFNIKTALLLLHGLRHRNLDFIDVSGNMKALSTNVRLNQFDILQLSTICVRAVNLENNDIIEIPLNSFLNSRFSQCIEYFSISDNSIVGSYFIPLIPFLHFPRIQVLDISNMMSLRASQPQSVSPWDSIALTNKAVSSTRPKLIIHISKTLKKLNMSKIYARNDHPSPDIEVVLEAPALQVMDVSYTGITWCKPGFVVTVLGDLKVLNISGWICLELNNHFLDGIQTLETLVWRQSGLDKGLTYDPTGILLSKLHRLLSVDFSENSLTDLNINLFQSQASTLRTVLLDDNYFTHIPECFGSLANLSYLSLKNNKISSLSDTDMSLLGKLQNIKIAFDGNLFICSCDNIESVKWTVSNKLKLVDFDHLKCSNGNFLSHIADSINEFEIACSSKFWLKFSVSVTVVVICLIILSAVGMRYRITLEYFYLRLRMFVQRYRPVPEVEGYDFDAFLSHSHHDTDWVVNVLYNTLTTRYCKNICIHQKDFQVGEWISDEIIRCIDQSRKVVFVITSHFLNSEWSTYELEMARMHAFRSGRSGLVMIMKDSIPLQDMPKVLKHIWWKVVCLEWPRDEQDDMAISLFWDKLNMTLSTE